MIVPITFIMPVATSCFIPTLRRIDNRPIFGYIAK